MSSGALVGSTRDQICDFASKKLLKKSRTFNYSILGPAVAGHKIQKIAMQVNADLLRPPRRSPRPGGGCVEFSDLEQRAAARWSESPSKRPGSAGEEARRRPAGPSRVPVFQGDLPRGLPLAAGSLCCICELLLAVGSFCCIRELLLYS